MSILKKLILLILINLLIFSYSTSAKTEKLKIATHQWSSQAVGAQIIGMLFEMAGEKVEYVFACMQGNEDSQAYVAKCSCSIDYIDDQMTYDDYVEAETIMSLRQIYGEKSVMFRNTPNAMEIYSNMQNLLAEAEMECF